jgi:hypothetical protein
MGEEAYWSMMESRNTREREKKCSWMMKQDCLLVVELYFKDTAE